MESGLPFLFFPNCRVSAPDVSVQAQMVNLLKQLKARFGLPLLFITHNVSVANYMSGRPIVMNSWLMAHSDQCQEW